MITKDEYHEYHESAASLLEGEIDPLDAEQCDACGEVVIPESAGKSYENSDADGNRGIWLDCWECPECGAGMG